MNAISATQRMGRALGTLARALSGRGLRRGSAGALAQVQLLWESDTEASLTRLLVDAGLADLVVVASCEPLEELRVLEAAAVGGLTTPKLGTVLIDRFTIASSFLMADLQQGQPFTISDSPETIRVIFESGREAGFKSVRVLPLRLHQSRPGVLAIFGETGLSLVELQRLASGFSQRLNPTSTPGALAPMLGITQETKSPDAAPALALALTLTRLRDPQHEKQEKHESRPAFEAMQSFMPRPPCGGMARPAPELCVCADGTPLAVGPLSAIVRRPLNQTPARCVDRPLDDESRAEFECKVVA